MSRVSGHSLRKEGRPYALDLCRECREDVADNGTWRDEHGNRSWSASGHALCSCGEMSPHFTADRPRKAWHSAHKIAVAESRR